LPDDFLVVVGILRPAESVYRTRQLHAVPERIGLDEFEIGTQDRQKQFENLFVFRKSG
jgi:hypothetical protein